MSTPASDRKPFWLYPNLLSLDAPLVALVWLYIFSQSWRLYIPWSAYAGLGLVVWAVYALDRLLDVAMLPPDSPVLEWRHRFHHRHRPAFQCGIALALISAVTLLFTSLPVALLKHLLLAAVMVAGYFGLAMISSQDDDQIPHSKNLLAGVTFAFGTSLAAHVYRSELGIYELFSSPEFFSFAALCAIQINAIDVWRRDRRPASVEERASDELAVTIPLAALALLSLGYALADQERAARTHHYAVLTAGGLLYVINRYRQRLPYEALCGLADLAMILPLLVVVAAGR